MNSRFAEMTKTFETDLLAENFNYFD